MSKQSIAFLNHLVALWKQEHKTVHMRFVEERQRRSLQERVQKGAALCNLEIVDTDAALGGRITLWIAPEQVEQLEAFRIGPGAPVRLWKEDPDSDSAVLGTVVKRRKDRIGVVVDDFPEVLEEGIFHLDRDEPQATFERGLRALERFRDAPSHSRTAVLRDVLCGDALPQWETGSRASFLNTSLNEPQKEAVRYALNARDIALIHGPPGTGKTYTLVEIIRQAIAAEESVLVTAASNAAVDNIAERLIASGVHIVRLGHPARVSEQVEAYTLDAQLEQTEEFKLSRKWIIEANALRRKIRTGRERGTLRRSERRELVKEMRSLFRDARTQLNQAKERIIERSEVICSTAAGADSAVLEEQMFDLVVMDEATQATDPIALVACSRAHRVIMAGDPCQLPPTVIDIEVDRAGLGSTFFERLADNEQIPVRMLTVQYRMHEKIMTFPSERLYSGQLVADPSVAHHQLDMCSGVEEDELRVGPLWFIDSAGKGWDEERGEEDTSTYNPEQAERTVEEVRRILQRGVVPSDVAVITPYDAQVRILRQALREECEQGLEVGSIDGFQGREKEAIVLDLVRSNERNEIGFLNDIRRMNVALTRARRFLLVIGDSATLSSSSFYNAFIEYTERVHAYKSAWDDGL